jgi:hypothetical protein
MQAMNSFGQEGARFEWESPGPGCAVDYLDLNIQINRDGTLTTSTFQKPMNLYLFRPPASVQPPSILYGLIYGTLHRLFWQNSEKDTFETLSLKFFQQLQARGHSTSKLAQLFLKAATRVDVSSIPVPKPPNNTLGGPGVAPTVPVYCTYASIRKTSPGEISNSFSPQSAFPRSRKLVLMSIG